MSATSRKSIILLTVSIALAALGFAGYVLLHHTQTYTVPDVELKYIDGSSAHLQDYHGKPVLVTFWATTCRLCIKEIPDLIALHREFGPRGLEIIAIAMPYDHPASVARYSQQRGLPYKVALDVEAKAVRTFDHVRVTPTNFLLAPDGHIVMKETGMLNVSRARRLITALLNEKG